MRTIILFLGFILTFVFSYSQEVWMIDGRVYGINEKTEIDSTGLTVLNKHNKAIKVDTSDVFCIIHGNDTTFLYKNENLTQQQATMFMKGQIDGSHYKNYWLNGGAFVTGAVAPFGLGVLNFSPFISPVVSGVYVVTATSFPPNIKKAIPDEKLRNNKYYVAGFKYAAARKKVKSMTIWSIGGLAAGITTAIILERQ